MKTMMCKYIIIYVYELEIALLSNYIFVPDFNIPA